MLPVAAAEVTGKSKQTDLSCCQVSALLAQGQKAALLPSLLTECKYTLKTYPLAQAGFPMRMPLSQFI